jgi:DNA invertase Pin-like site-specific DNA recombinase
VTARPAIRAAIYTRKSTEDGLEQEFNSLDAQYEACAAYIASQRHEGWSLVRERFDDGGVSGSTLDRPGLQRLMAEVDAGRISMIVVYKIDRLTRSLADFARLVDRLDAAKASFVSVTQAFNTSTSMGRLTLNVLLSFAQFEREVTAERIRDKIAASKRKGLWMGGTVPLGCRLSGDPGARSLICDQEEAGMVRQVFDLYDELGNIRLVEERAGELGMRTRAQVLPSGLTRGGRPFTRGQIHYLLTNPTYRGLIRHKDKTYTGNHPAIISEDQWERVQKALLTARARPRRGVDTTAGDAGALLLGKHVDETGDRLAPSEIKGAG